MSYEKAVKFARNPKKAKPQPVGFSALARDERRREPWLGGAWFAPGMDEEMRQFPYWVFAYKERGPEEVT